MKEEILQKLIEKTAAALRVDPSELSPQTNIKTDVDLKSLELVGIISQIEEEYDCFIKYTELMHADTIEQAAEIIEEHLSNNTFNFNDMKNEMVNGLIPILSDKTGRVPIILPIVMDVKSEKLGVK